MPALNSSTPLWDFALEFYAQPHVAEACLLLQDQHQADVCLLIGLRWLDERQQFLTCTEIEDLLSHTRKWTQRVITPLREMRRLLKHQFENYVHDDKQQQLRTQIKSAELMAEKKLLSEIELWAINIPVTKNFPEQTNLEKYMKTLKLEAPLIESVLQKFSSQ